MKTVEQFLQENGIDYILKEHPAVFTCQEAKEHCCDVQGVGSKNLFLRDDKKKRYFLVVLPSEKRADLKNLAEIFGVKKISFASDEDLKQKLGLEPGGVSIFGLLNDEDVEVELYMDREFYEAGLVHFHPNRNTASIEISKEMLKKFLDLIKHHLNVIDIA